MDKIKNLSIRKTIVLYMVINLIVCFLLSVFVMRAASEIQNEIWWKYVDQKEYAGMLEGEGEKYITNLPRPNAGEMKRIDHHISEACDFLQTFTVLIISVAGSIISILLFYRHKLKNPIEELELASQKIGQNDLNFHITYTNKDEMGRLCREFERMREQLAENHQKLWKMIEEEKALRAAIAHDIRSPLSVLEGYQEMLMEYLPNREIDIKQAMEMVAESRKQIERMDIFVETMRKMSSLETRELRNEEITSRQLEGDIQAELRILEKKYQKKCYLKAALANECFAGDKEVIMEVVDNLLLNALRYAKTKVEMEKKYQKKCYLKAALANECFAGDKEVIMEVVDNLLLNALRYAKTKVEIMMSLSFCELKISVKDDGIGFTEDRENVTKLFCRRNVKDSLKHAGMGMYISRLYCEKHGGELIVENSENSGAAITAVFHRIA